MHRDRGKTWEELLRRAYRLAYFLHADRDVALQIAVEALAKLDLATCAQTKRKYYRPVGRPAAGGRRSSPLRSKVVMSPPQLLQRLVYIESERFERARAADGELDRAARLVHFLKHLARISVRRNCLYVTVAVARLLYGYSTAQTMDLLSVVLQDPDRVPDDSYVRSVKKRLMEELRERFPELRTTRTERGEERFEPANDAADHRCLVAACLRHFVPWATHCPIPAAFAADEQTLPELASDGADPDREHPREMNRIHTLLHPLCFDRLVRGLSLREPEAGLQLPRFPGEDRGAGRSSAPPREPPELSADDVDAAGGELRRRGGARFARRDALSLDADGREVARWRPDRPTSVELRLDRDPEILEVHAWHQGRPRLVAVHLPAPRPALAGAEHADTADEETVLATGRGSSLRLALHWRGDADLGWCRLTATYRRGAVERIAAAWRTRLTAWRPARHPARKIAWATSLALALLAAGLVWLHSEAPPTTQPPPAVSPAAPAAPVSRGTTGPWPSLPLAEVRSIFLDDLGDTPPRRALRQALRDRLRASGRFRLSADRETADALLTTAAGTAPDLPALRLLNAAGETVWAWQLEGEDAAAAAATASEDLLAAAGGGG